MTQPMTGIHHITAIAADPQRNLDFYTRILGLRLIKLTVNFDDPGTYHFYFGDSAGRPGTLLTFFPWQSIRPGRRGPGQVGTVAFRIPTHSLGYWTERLKHHGVNTGKVIERFGAPVLPFTDPDGMRLELAPSPREEGVETLRLNRPTPPEHAILGFHNPSLLVSDIGNTAELLTGTFGLQLVRQEGRVHRFSAAGAAGAEIGGQVDVEEMPGEGMGAMGAGVVHHIAFRARNDADQLAWRERLVSVGMNVTEVRERQYFRSIYFREPGHILFEIATDGPGFAVDESLETLGSGLRLPPWLEAGRSEIEQILPPLKLPEAQVG